MYKHKFSNKYDFFSKCKKCNLKLAGLVFKLNYEGIKIINVDTEAPNTEMSCPISDDEYAIKDIIE